jgi:ribosomal RNA-processing protein 1
MATTISKSSAPSQREAKFARSLVHPEKSVRDATFNALQEYTRGVKQMEEIEMLKLWKSLYYCMWLADKREVQEELASSFANMLSGFRTNKLKLLFIGTFFQILLREWSLLDMHRMNKFYFLIRVIIRKALQTSFEQLPNTDFLVGFNDVLHTSALTQRPNGIRYHIADIFLSELHTASNGNCDTQFFLLSVEPFLKFLVSGDENVVLDRIGKCIFEEFANSFARETVDSSANGESAPRTFSNVDTRYIQAKLFDAASAPETAGKYRPRLYALHKAMSEITRIDFVDVSALEKKVVDEVGASEEEKAKKDKKKKKRAIEETASEQVESEKNDAKKKKKKSA